MNKNIDFKTKVEIEVDLDRIAKIINCDIFSQYNSQHPLRQSAFIELVIRLRDLLFKCEDLGKRINFSDDIKILKNENGNEIVKDITDAVTYIRNAACHIESEKNIIDKTIIYTFNVAYGKCNMFSTPNTSLAADYDDDICFFYGEQKLYLKRHIIRAFKEAKQFLNQKN